MIDLIISSIIYICCIAKHKPKPKNCPADSKYFQEFDSCLKAFPGEKSYYGARHSCQDNGGDLVIVDSLAKNYYAKSEDMTLIL